MERCALLQFSLAKSQQYHAIQLWFAPNHTKIRSRLPQSPSAIRRRRSFVSLVAARSSSLRRRVPFISIRSDAGRRKGAWVMLQLTSQGKETASENVRCSFLFRSDERAQGTRFLRAQRRVIVLHKIKHPRSAEAVVSRTSAQVNNTHANFRIIKSSFHGHLKPTSLGLLTFANLICGFKTRARGPRRALLIS